MRGNAVMKGYLADEGATEEALGSGWFRTGDLAVVHPSGYLEIKDRAKDIIISGGENISTVEVEAVLYRHPAVLEASVVARPHPHWGETPCAFVTLREGHRWEEGGGGGGGGGRTSEAEIVEFCRARLAHFKAPRYVVQLPGGMPQPSRWACVEVGVLTA